MAEPRETFARRWQTISSYLSEDPARFERFFIEFCSLGVNMTEPVEAWIDWAGLRCLELGLDELGTRLRAHAKHEAGHHLLMIRDTRELVKNWNNRHPEQLDSTQLLSRPISPGVSRYRNLHERVIASQEPFCQMAIEYEIEMLSVKVGPTVLDQCVAALGQAILQSLSFLTEHVELDVGHTRFNAITLDRLLTRHPEYLSPLVATGREALSAYAAFLDDCALAVGAPSGRRFAVAGTRRL